MSSPQPKLISTTPYEVCVYRTRTGDVVGWIPCAAIPTWERGLNIAGSWTAFPSLDDRYLTKADLNGWIEEWDWSWAVVQGQHIWQAGPVKGETYPDDGANSTTIAGVGLLAMLQEKRALLNPSRAAVDVITGIDADVAFGITAVSEKGAPIPAGNQNLALQTIIKRLFEGLLAEPGGDLPIDLPTEEYAGTAIRGYPGYELGSPGGRAVDITQVSGGPEMELVPFFTTTDRLVVRHRLHVGKPENNGRLGQLGYAHMWDSNQALLKVGFERNGEQRTNRHWEKGEGSDRTAVVKFAQDLTGVTTGPTVGQRPLLETVGSGHINASETATLQGYADAAVLNGQHSRLTLTVEVRPDGDDGQGGGSRSPVLTAVSPGDTAILKLKNHRRLPDGPYEVRILRMRGTSDLTRAGLDVQVLSGGFS